MNKLKLKRLRVENFKCIESDIFEFNNHLTVLDGPNGYGKTTLFDAVELLITGAIHRFMNYEQPAKSPEQIVLLNQQDRPCFLLGEFSRDAENEASVFIGFYCPAELGANARKPGNLKGSFKRYILKSPPRELSLDVFEENGKSASLEDLNKVFGLRLADEDFKTQFYVQQEDTLHFLERKDRVRMESMSRLFGMEHVSKEKKKIDQRLEAEKENRKKTISNIEKVDGELAVLRKSFSDTKPILHESIGSLLSTSQKFDWDVESPPDIDKNIKAYKHRLDKLSAILKNPSGFSDKYKEHLKNGQIDRFLNAPRFLEDMILTQHFRGKYDELEKQSRQNDLCEKGLKDWILEALKQQVPSLLAFEKLGQLVGFNADYATVHQRLKDITATLLTNGKSEAIALELMEDRQRLFDRYSVDQYKDNSACPLCGEEYENREKLNDSIRIKERVLRDSLSKESRRLSDQLEKVDIEVLKPFRARIDLYLEKYPTVSRNFLQRLQSVQNDTEQQAILSEFHEWSSASTIEFDELINKKATIPPNLDERIANFKGKLNAAKIVIDAKFADYIEIFKNTLDSDLSKLEQAEFLLQKINGKMAYLDFSHHQGQQVSIKTKEKERKVQIGKRDQINERIGNLDKLSTAYKTAMRDHANQLINDIRIPFYIYSGKILQNCPQGSGVFIKKSGTLGKSTPITFTQDGSDNDVIFSLSSGQLVGVVIAFTLAMHRVYGTQSQLGFILIDDPIQSMDDINMSSLVELFRNEFPSTQLIFSTHDDSVSAYMRYKFGCFGLDAERINMQERLSENVVADES